MVNADPKNPAHWHGLQPVENTFAEVLGRAHYTTAIFGKWHLGYEVKYNPVRHGFGRFRGYVSGNVDYQSKYDRMETYDWWAFWNYNYADGAWPGGFAANYKNSDGSPMKHKINPGTRKDNSFAGFQVQALKAAKFAGCSNPKLNETMDLAMNGLKYMQGGTGRFHYSDNGNSPMTKGGSLNQLGVGAYCMYLGEGNLSEEAQRAAKALYEAGFDPQANRAFYRIYYQANANFWVDGVKGGPNWTQYNAAFKPWLVKNQDRSKDPKKDGSWSHAAPPR